MDDNTPSSDIAARLLACARTAFKADASKVGESTELNTLGDSLDFVDFLSDVEKEFDIELSNEQIGDLRTVGDLLSAIRQALAQRSGDSHTS